MVKLRMRLKDETGLDGATLLKGAVENNRS